MNNDPKMTLDLIRRKTTVGRVQIVGAVFGPVPSTLPGGVRMTKSDAWDLCRKAGRANGIPDHAWTKEHSNRGWKWRTTNLRNFKLREAAMRRRKENEQ